jgi:hypothetical protein
MDSRQHTLPYGPVLTPQPERLSAACAASAA